MGAWSPGIYGSDTAQDVREECKAVFLCNDVETALEKLDACVRRDFDESEPEEWGAYFYALADFMWKHGILTDGVRDKAVEMIDSGFDLEIWAQEGKSLLKQREKVLAKLREQLLSPMPPKKKIKLGRYLKPIFETGDVIAFQLRTADKYYLHNCFLSEEEFRAYDGKYVVFRKVGDKINSLSSIETHLKEYWAVFQLYCNVFDSCPTMEELKGIPFADPLDSSQRKWNPWGKCNDTFTSESSMLHFKKRNYTVIGKDMSELPDKYNGIGHIFMGHNSPYSNAETYIINAIYR